MSLFHSSFQHLYRLWTDISPIIIVAIGGFYIYRAVASLAHNSVTSNNDAIGQPRRGRQPPIAWVSSLGAFHPLAPQPAEWENTALGRLLRGVDHVVAAVVETAPFLIGELTLLVERARQITLIPNFDPYVAPLRTRLRRGLVQVSGLPSTLSPCDIQYRYLCPISSLAAFFIAFALFGMSTWLAGLVCSTGCVVIIAGDNLGALDDDEGNRDNALDQGVTSTPDMANVRLIAMLHEQT